MPHLNTGPTWETVVPVIRNVCIVSMLDMLIDSFKFDYRLVVLQCGRK